MPQETTPPAATGTVLHEVRAHFSDPVRLQDAIGKLSLAGFDRADLSLPEPAGPAHATPETAARPANTEEDARQQRALHASTAAAAASLAAAGVVIGTGGAALPAVAAAVAAGAAAGGGLFAVSSAVNADEQSTREADAAAGMLVLAVRAPTAARRDDAEAILRGAGGSDVVRS